MTSKTFIPFATLTLLLAGLLFLAPTLRAQESAVAEVVVPVVVPASVSDAAVEIAPSVQTPLAGPRIAHVGVTRVVADVPPAPHMRDVSRRNTAWMIVGGATLLVGLVIGGDAGTIVALTGGAIGLVGLFRYLQ